MYRAGRKNWVRSHNLLGTSRNFWVRLCVQKLGTSPPAKTGYAPITFECIAQLLGALMRAKIGYTPAKTGYASTTFGYAARFLGMSMRAKVGYTPTKTGYALTTFGYTPQLLGTPMCAKVGYTPAKTGYTPTKVGYAVINDEQNTNEK